jgi:hypothetical protein
MSLWADGRKSTVFLGKARESADKFIASEGAENVSIHAFDRNDNFSHVVEAA